MLPHDFKNQKKIVQDFLKHVVCLCRNDATGSGRAARDVTGSCRSAERRPLRDARACVTTTSTAARVASVQPALPSPPQPSSDSLLLDTGRLELFESAFIRLTTHTIHRDVTPLNVDSFTGKLTL